MRIGALRGHILHAGLNEMHLNVFREGKEPLGIVGITSLLIEVTHVCVCVFRNELCVPN